MLEKGQIYTDGYCLYQIELIDSDTVVYSIKNKKFTVKRASFEAMNGKTKIYNRKTFEIFRPTNGKWSYKYARSKSVS